MGETQPLISSTHSFPSQKAAQTEERHCCAAVLSELKCHNLLLRHNREDLFYSCQWDWSPAVFVLYRMAAASYAFTVHIISIIHYEASKWSYFPWLVWFTNWSFFILTAHLLLAALLTVLYSYERGRCFQKWSLRSSIYSFLPDGELETTSYCIPPTPLPWYFKLDWLLYNISSVAAVIVTVVFFSVLYPRLNRDGDLSWSDGTLHLSNTLLILLEVSLCAIPVQLMHCFYSLIFGMIYLIFSVIYWEMNHNNVLYPKVLDWNNPLSTIGFVIVLNIIVVPLLQLLLFGLYKFKIYIYKAIYMSNR